MQVRIREIREKRGMTQKQLADAIGRRPNSISMYETGSMDIPLKILNKIAQELHCTLDDLIIIEPLEPALAATPED